MRPPPRAGPPARSTRASRYKLARECCVRGRPLGGPERHIRGPERTDSRGSQADLSDGRRRVAGEGCGGLACIGDGCGGGRWGHSRDRVCRGTGDGGGRGACRRPGAHRRRPDGEQADRRPPCRPGRGLLHRPRPRVRPGRRAVADGRPGPAVDVGADRVRRERGAQPGPRPGPLGGTGRAAQPGRRARRGVAGRARAPGGTGGPRPDGGRLRGRRRRPRDARPAGPAAPGRPVARRCPARRSRMASGDLRRRRMGPAGMATDDRRVRQRPFCDLAHRRRRRPPGRRCAGAGRAQRLRRRAPVRLLPRRRRRPGARRRAPPARPAVRPRLDARAPLAVRRTRRRPGPHVPSGRRRHRAGRRRLGQPPDRDRMAIGQPTSPGPWSNGQENSDERGNAYPDQCEFNRDTTERLSVRVSGGSRWRRCSTRVGR